MSEYIEMLKGLRVDNIWRSNANDLVIAHREVEEVVAARDEVRAGISSGVIESPVGIPFGEYDIWSIMVNEYGIEDNVNSRYINSMAIAWDYILETMGESISIEYVSKIAKLIDAAESGWRSFIVSIYHRAGNMQEGLSKLGTIEDDVDRAAEYFCYLVSTEGFFCRNGVALAWTIANKALIEAGVGVFEVPSCWFYKFRALVGGRSQQGRCNTIRGTRELKSFLKEHCIIRFKDNRRVKFYEVQ